MGTSRSMLVIGLLLATFEACAMHTETPGEGPPPDAGHTVYCCEVASVQGQDYVTSITCSDAVTLTDGGCAVGEERGFVVP